MSLTNFTGVSGSKDQGTGIVVDAGTGTVTVEVDTGGTWHLIKTYTADAAEVFNPLGFKFRVTATGDATFSLSNVLSAV